VRLFGAKKSDGRKVGGARLDLPKIRKNPLIEIIAINTGSVFEITNYLSPLITVSSKA